MAVGAGFHAGPLTMTFHEVGEKTYGKGEWVVRETVKTVPYG
jgi:hypothetical protein